MKSSRFFLAALVLMFVGALSAPSAAQGGYRLEGPAQGTIELTVRWVGVGGAAREGEWAAVQIFFTDHSERPRSLMFSIPSKDIDGDTAVYARVAATNPGMAQSLWLYYPIPFSSTQSTLTIDVHEAVERPSDAGDHAKGEFLLRATGPIQNLYKSTVALGAIVGNDAAGVEKYVRVQRTSRSDIGGHERLEVVRSITPETIPDRWHGLRQFDLMIWTNGRPGALSLESGAAIREWVSRGGHLVIVLPAVAQEWLADDLHNPLASILPRVRTTRYEEAPLEPYRELIIGPSRQGTPERSLPEKAVVHTFEPLPDADPQEAARLILGPDGECIVATRIVGHGAVTLVGINVADRMMGHLGLPEVAPFWNRILGRRGKTTPSREDELSFSDQDIFYDRMISSEINQSGKAQVGLLLGLVVFCAYWAIAAPISFTLLKRTGKGRHAWVAFGGAALLFTAIAWGGAALVRPSRIEVTQLTFLDHVYGQPIQRARTWASVLLPDYGSGILSIDTPEEGPTSDRFNNVIIPWERPASDGGRGNFPDAREYLITSANPDVMEIPTRATVKLIQADWAGPPLTDWVMPLPVGTEGAPGDIRIVDDPKSSIGGFTFEGKLRHDLPGPLTDVRIIVLRGQRNFNTRLDDNALIASGNAWKLSDPWLPGQELNLAALRSSGDSGPKHDSFDRYLDGSVRSPGISGINTNPTDADALAELGFLNSFPFKERPTQNFQARYETRALREITHGLDLSRWLTRPCFIIIGHVEIEQDEAAITAPLPLHVDGRAVQARGRTLVRWIYPLPDQPPEYSKTEDEGGQSTGPRPPRNEDGRTSFDW